MSTLSQILAEKITNKKHEGLLKHPVLLNALDTAFEVRKDVKR